MLTIKDKLDLSISGEYAMNPAENIEAIAKGHMENKIYVSDLSVLHQYDAALKGFMYLRPVRDEYGNVYYRIARNSVSLVRVDDIVDWRRHKRESTLLMLEYTDKKATN